MSASSRAHAASAPAETARDIAEKHDLRIHRAKQLNWAVRYNGVNRSIAGLYCHPNESEMVVYLTGSSIPVRPCEITIVEQPV